MKSDASLYLRRRYGFAMPFFPAPASTLDVYRGVTAFWQCGAAVYAFRTVLIFFFSVLSNAQFPNMTLTFWVMGMLVFFTAVPALPGEYSYGRLRRLPFTFSIAHEKFFKHETFLP